MWKVDIREVTFLGSEYNEEAYRIGNIVQFFRHRTMSLVGGDASRRAHTTIGKKNIVEFKVLLCLLSKKIATSLFLTGQGFIEATLWL